MCKKNKKEVIKVSFVDSMSAEDVTGSSVFVKTPHHSILLDCGLHQTNDRFADLLVNRRRPKEYKPKDIDLIFCSHSHIDHIGLLPLMVSRGCQAKIIVANQNGKMLPILLNDSARINERDILVINSQHGTAYDPLYTEEDVTNTLKYIQEYPINQKIAIDDEVAFELIPNGHLLGSVQIKLYLTVNNVTKTLLYTGDIGSNKIYNPYVGDFQVAQSATWVIGECTYGDRPKQKNGRKERKNDLAKLKTIVDTQVHQMGGRVVIPSFAQSRSQSLVYFLHEIYKDEEWQPEIYVDSPLAC